MHTCAQRIRIGPPINIGFGRVYWLQSVEFEFSLKYFHAHVVFSGTVCAPPALGRGKLLSHFIHIYCLTIQLTVLVTAALVLKKNVDRKLWTPIGFRRTSYVPRLSFFMAVNTTIIVGNVFS